MFKQDNLLTCVRATRAKQFLQQGNTIFESGSATRGNIKYLEIIREIRKILKKAKKEKKGNNKYLKCNPLPVGRIHGLHNGHGRLKLPTTAKELAVERDILW